MKISRAWWFSIVIFGALCVLLCAPVRIVAQTGDKAVWTVNGVTPTLAPSSAWIDASAFCNSGGTINCTTATDFCLVLSAAISKLLLISPLGGVVDARGVLGIPAGSPPVESCSSNPFPSSVLPQTNTIPVTILLPPYTIQLNPTSGAGTGTWVIPSNVRLVGTGFQTVLLGASNCCSGYMVEMGQPPSPGNSCTTTYTGIGIEHLQLVTQGTLGSYYGGIDNECAGPSSYVSDVKIGGNPGPTNQTSLGGNALTIGPGATNSGPYTDLLVLAAPGPGCGVNNPPALNCVSVQTQTRGIHGISCLGSTVTGAESAAILVNGSNNSIEDIHVEAFYDGVGLGNTTSSPIGNLFVSNVTGGVSCPNGTVSVMNAVHIYGSVTSATIVGVSNENKPAVSIQDDETPTTIQNCNGEGCAFPITSGMYILGRPNGSTIGQYSRFAVNPANPTVYGNSSTVVPTWGMGNSTAPQGMCYTPGAIFSYTATTGGGGVYLCTSAKAWKALP